VGYKSDLFGVRARLRAARRLDRASEALARPRSARDVEAQSINLGGDDLCKRLTNLRVIRRHPSRECE
jgi:hypothetical protein